MIRTSLPLAIALLTTLTVVPLAQAEKADRSKPFIIQSDNGGEGYKVAQRTRLNGNVVISQGSLQLRAETVDLRVTADGFYQAVASGAADKPVSFSQGRDVPGESVQGQADQVEFDTKSDTVRFVGNAVVKVLRGTAVAEEVSGAVVLYDNRNEVFRFEGGQASPNPAGRTRLVIMPRTAPADTGASAPPLPLQPSTSLSLPAKTAP